MSFLYRVNNCQAVLLKRITKKTSFVLFGINLAHFGPKSNIPGTTFISGMVGLAPKWVRLDPKLEKNPGLFQIRFQYIWLIEPLWS